MGLLMDMVFFVDVAGCGMNMMYEVDGQNLDVIDNSCCDNVVAFVTGQDNLQLAWNDLATEMKYVLIAFEYSCHSWFLAQTEQSVVNEQYPPPLLVKNIRLLEEVYLI